MEYQKLRIISYESQEKHMEEYQARFSSPATFKTGLSIVPFSKTTGLRLSSEQFELFYYPTRKNQLLEDQIYINSKEITEELTKLPPIVKEKLIFNSIINEIQSTNEFEGVESSKEELTEAARQKNTNKKTRFKGIVSLYLNIGASEYETITKIEDFRNIYDNLFLGEINEKDIPDGKLFRKKTVYIRDMKNQTKHVHQGASSEKLVIEDLETLILFMNSAAFPTLLKATITHYYFEYIHPFYDGNGRMGRFILSSYLARKLDEFTGVTISNSVSENKNKYLEAFSEVSNPRNKGELTHFVQTMFELIESGQRNLLKDLKEYNIIFKHYTSYLNKKDNMSEEEKRIIFVYIQNFIFDEMNPIEDQDMADTLDISRHILKGRLAPLVEKKVIKQIKKKPSIHVLTDDFKSKLEQQE